MTIYAHTVTNLGNTIKQGLDRIAGAIETVATKPTYNINVIVMPGTTADEVDQRVDETIERIQAREATLGG